MMMIIHFLQVDTGYHTKRGTWNSEEHVTQGTEILIDFIKKIQKDYPTWPKDHQLKGTTSPHPYCTT